MTAIQQNRYDALLRRVADLKGPGSKVNDVLEELFPVLDVERVPAELLFLMGTKVVFGGGQITGVAGQAPRAQVFNPVGSGKLVTVTGVYATLDGTGGQFRWGIVIIPFATSINTEIIRDSRGGAAQRGSAAIRQLSSVALAPGTGQVRLPQATLLKLDDPNDLAVLAPGSGFEIGGATLAQTLNYTFYWRERQAEPSELNF